jgi:hypothetical protein
MDLGRHTSLLYHFTSIDGATQILTSKQFRLTPAIGTDSELKHQRGKTYYLSTTRVKTGRYTKVESYNQGALLVLNGLWFSRHYKVVPVDYWGRSFGTESESEDRVLSNEPYIKIPDLHKVIEEIHVYRRDKDDAGDNSQLRKLIIMAKVNKIKIYGYGDHKAFLTQNKAKADLKATDLKGNTPYNPSGRKKANYLEPYYELFYKNDPKHLSVRAKQLYYNLQRSYRMQDMLTSLKAEVHNSKKSESSHKFIEAMKKSGATSPENFLHKMADKWQKIHEVESNKEHEAWLKRQAAKKE